MQKENMEISSKEKRNHSYYMYRECLEGYEEMRDDENDNSKKIHINI